MKIRRVEINRKKRAIVVHSGRGVHEFPFALLRPSPSATDPVRRAYADPEFGREAVTWVLESGQEGSVHIDNVLAYNRDPLVLSDLTQCELTVRLQELVKESGLSKREIIRRLGTSASQLYRILDQTNYRKSLRQFLALLHVLGYEVNLEVSKKEFSAPDGKRKKSGVRRSGA